MAFDKEKMHKRNAEIGQLLATARARRNLTMAECASEIGVSRQHYSALERGEAFVTAVQLEVLLQFLNLPNESVWPQDADSGKRKIRRLPVTISRQETIYLIVDVVDS